MRLFKRLAHWNAHHRLMASGSLAILFGIVSPRPVDLVTRIIATWDVYAVLTIGFCWITISHFHPRDIHRRAQAQDVGSHAIFVFILVAACMSVVAVGSLSFVSKGFGHHMAAGRLLTSVMAVLTSWILLHTIFTLRYAHMYYGDKKAWDSKEERGGLIFPGDAHVDYIDFAYFSFIIGMTCQVSDVQISSRRIRRMALVQGLLAFAFNAVILAVTLNIVGGLL